MCSKHFVSASQWFSDAFEIWGGEVRGRLEVVHRLETGYSVDWLGWALGR